MAVVAARRERHRMRSSARGPTTRKALDCTRRPRAPACARAVGAWCALGRGMMVTSLEPAQGSLCPHSSGAQACVVWFLSDARPFPTRALGLITLRAGGRAKLVVRLHGKQVQDNLVSLCNKSGIRRWGITIVVFAVAGLVAAGCGSASDSGSRPGSQARGWVDQPVTFRAGGVTIYATFRHPNV